MFIYVELKEKVKIGDTVQFCKNNGKFIAGYSLKGQKAIVRKLNNNVAFLEILPEDMTKLAADSGTAIGVTLNMPVKISSTLKVTKNK